MYIELANDTPAAVRHTVHNCQGDRPGLSDCYNHGCPASMIFLPAVRWTMISEWLDEPPKTFTAHQLRDRLRSDPPARHFLSQEQEMRV